MTLGADVGSGVNHLAVPLCRWCWLSVGGKCFVFVNFPEYLQIFPEGTLRCDVVPPVFKARLLPWAPQQIIFLVSPAGKETPSLLGFGCHISLMLTPLQIRHFPSPSDR